MATSLNSQSGIGKVYLGNRFVCRAGEKKDFELAKLLDFGRPIIPHNAPLLVKDYCSLNKVEIDGISLISLGESWLTCTELCFCN